MNTRQKLTLGIAAIFMVTLTIVGITYAYFVTKITYEDEEVTQITVNSATIGALYSTGDKSVSLNNVIPGAEVYKAWAVELSKDSSAVSVALNVTTTAPTGEGTVQFKNDGTKYDNIELSLVRVSADTLTAKGLDKASFLALDDSESAQDTLEDLFDETGTTVITDAENPLKAPYSDKVVNFSSNLELVEDVNYYILKVKYIETNENQNAENNASVEVIPSIAESLEEEA